MACNVCMGINSHRCPVCGDDFESEAEGIYLVMHIGTRQTYRTSEDVWLDCPDDEDLCSSANPFCQIPLNEAYVHHDYVDVRDSDHINERLGRAS